MEMTVREAKRHVGSLRELKKDLDILHRQILQVQEDLPETKAAIYDGSIMDAIAYLSDYESVLLNSIENAKILL